jgi:3',5'-cyclic AMP phosphodiesterase CpdA
MRIAHISDLHISENDSEQSLERVYKLLKVLSFKGFDHIIITGDVTENGTLAEFELVKEMLDLFDLLDPQKATVIIGNHDIYGGLQRLEDLIHYPACFTKSDFNHKVAEFHDTFRPLLANAKQNHGRIYPFLKKVNTTNILGLNSVRQFSRLMNPFGAKGLISAEQILHAQELLQDINDDDLLIIAVHHHFNPQAIKGKTLLQYLWRMI